MNDSAFKALSNRHFRVAVAALIILAAFLAYVNTFSGEFVWDDVSSILLHRNVQDPSKVLQLFREDQHAFGRGQGNFYRPLVSASFMLDYALSRPTAGDELSPFLFHVTNTLWHAAAALLFFLLLVNLKAPRAVQFVAPMLYVLHPLHTGAVAYISGRADMMAATFVYGGLCFAARDSGSWRGRAGLALGASVCFVFALLSKESAFIFPVLAGLLIFRPVDEGAARATVYARRSAPFGLAAAIFAAYGVLRVTVLSFGAQTAPDSAFGQRMLELLQSFALYVRLMVVPTDLHMERTLDGVGFLTAGFGAVLLGSTVALAVWAWRRGHWRAGIGLTWFLATWFPISGFFPLNAPMAEHWMYMPLAGILWAFAEIGNNAARKPAARYGLAAAAYAMGAVFLALAMDRNRDWHDNESLFVATLEQNPNSTRVRYNLAVTYEELLDNPIAARRHYEGLIESYQEKKRNLLGSGPEMFWDEELESHLSLGRIYSERNDYNKAAEHFSKVMQVAPDESNRALRATAAFGLGRCFLAAGDLQNAVELFRQAGAGRPDLRDDIERALGGRL